MAKDDKSAEDQLRDATWQWAGRGVMAAALVGCGFFLAYLQFGDAPELGKQVKEAEDRIVNLENQRETANTRLAKAERDAELCEKDLKVCDKAKRECDSKLQAAAE